MTRILTPAIITFLTELSFNNERTWFKEHDEQYRTALADFTALIDELQKEIQKFDATIEVIDPKKYLFRIYKDVRFSKDKLPYKQHFSAFIASGGKKNQGAGYYVHIEPMGRSFIVVGNYHYTEQWVHNWRSVLDTKPETIKVTLNNSILTRTFPDVSGDTLKRVPKGYNKDHAEKELLVFKSIARSHNLTKQEVQAADFVQLLSAKFKSALAFKQLMNHLAFS